jgi:hypothetical protein
MNMIELIKSLEGPTKARITTVTDVKMNKKDVATKSKLNPYLGAQKKSVQIVMLAPEYERAVNDQLQSEGKEENFTSQSRTWGTNIGNGLVEHSGKFYVSYMPVEHVSTEYLLDGEPIQKSLLEEFIPAVKSSGNQGTDSVVIFRSVQVSNIVELDII